MNGAQVLDIGRESIWLIVQLSAPMLVVALIVGITVGLLQTLTQVQEQTLAFVPKVLAVFVALLVSLPLMGVLMSDFMRHIAQRISNL